ncbi:MAG TPA: hypothetical protein VGN86_12575 [Pyrinomonadaceae bacterium]|jgi:hypothetical protein|nr:hypothetical protein [Pyrinomonadaceae bacterium]
MDVFIEAIKFNHDPNSATTDALTIRKNEDTEITVPEWQYVNEREQPETSAAAYACSQGKALTILVRLKRLNPKVKSVEVRCQSDGVLGNFGKDTVVFQFDPKGDVSDFKIFHLDGARMADYGVGKWEIVFEWTLIATFDTQAQKEFTQTTTHVVYTLLEPPKPPWGPDPKDPKYDYELPWTDVLERACSWAAGAKDRITAATKITTELYNLGKKDNLRKLTFEQNEDFAHLAVNGTDRFNLTKLLELLKTPNGLMKVNCTDCAILVSTFANILGCDLYQSQMGTNFTTNLIREIGVSKEHKTDFKYHEVAWEDPCKGNANLFDAFLQVDGDTEPSSPPFDPLLPVSIPFALPKGNDYHYRLVKKGEYCNAHDKTMTRRKIARQRFAVRQIDPELEQLLKEEFDFMSWKELPSLDRIFLGPIEKLNEEFLPVGWTSDDYPKVMKGELGVFELSEWIWRNGDDRAVRVLTYQCPSVWEARDFLLNLLGDFHSSGVKARRASQKNQDGFVVGDLAFAGPEDQAILFTRSNIVVFLQNAGSSSTSTLSFAHGIDLGILNILNREETTSVRSVFKRTEFARKTAPEINSTIHTKKEKRTMPANFLNSVWSSIRPAEGNPTDMRREGAFKIEEYDPETGRVEGRYYDVLYFEDVRFEGYIRYLSGTSYSFVFLYDIPDTDRRRIYEGQTVAEYDNVSIVGGRWRDVARNANEASTTRDDKDVANKYAQDEGVWIATKP